MSFECFATRWDGGPGDVVEQIPARALKFSLPLSDHGEASFTATVGPGSLWRQALSCDLSGILITSDGVPVWAGRMLPESQSDTRAFSFSFAEWGSFFERVPAVPLSVVGTNDHTLFRRLISDAQAIAGQDAGIILGTTIGGASSDLTINAWDSTSVEEEFRRLAEAAGGPEWFVDATRRLILGDHLGSTTPTAVLEYVEDSGDGRRGGNVISAHPGRTQAPGYTATIAVGAGQDALQIRATAEATALLAAGYPRQTLTRQYTDVTRQQTLQRHADADLAAATGMTTGYTLRTYLDDPDWTQVARGDTVRVEVDSDVYATERPLIFETRVLDQVVDVPDDGRPTCDWVVADVRTT